MNGDDDDIFKFQSATKTRTNKLGSSVENLKNVKIAQKETIKNKLPFHNVQ